MHSSGVGTHLLVNERQQQNEERRPLRRDEVEKVPEDAAEVEESADIFNGLRDPRPIVRQLVLETHHYNLQRWKEQP